LYVTLLNHSIQADDFVIKPFNNGNSFDIVGQEKICSCASMFNFVPALLGGNIAGCYTWKYGQIWGFQLSRLTQ